MDTHNYVGHLLYRVLVRDLEEVLALHTDLDTCNIQDTWNIGKVVDYLTLICASQLLT